MLVSLKWLSEYVPLSLPARDLAHRLTIAGVKVERIVTVGENWEGIKVGRVLDVLPHPDPTVTRLRLVKVDTGALDTPTVVCGAPNVAAGQRIVFGPVGVKYFDGHSGKLETLKQVNIRGFQSAGMVMSEKELGLSEAHEGILELPADAPVGADLADYMADTIFDIEVTPNRPDLLSILGVAWEVAAQTHVRVREPERVYPEAGSSGAASKTSVTIEDRDLCPRYLAGIVERVKVGPSPSWMQQRLISAGMRPINNVVDITNYVMLEMGQPLHAFDFRKLGGGRIVVRRARDGERLTTLDGIERALTPDMLVIADAQKGQAVAGVMGAADAEVTPATTTVLLEAANFNPVSIRATSGALGLRTEASVRFEKGLHPDLARAAAERAMSLLVQLTGGRAAKGLVDAYPRKRRDTRVEVTRERIQRVLGADVSASHVRTALTELGFGCRWVPPDRYVVRVPHWRTDVNIADDVIEEIARATGYDAIEPLPLGGAIPEPIESPLRDLRERIRDAAAAAGFQEVINYPLTNAETLEAVVPKEVLEMHPPLRLENPMSSDAVQLRASLRARILQSPSSSARASTSPRRATCPRSASMPQASSPAGAWAAGVNRPRNGSTFSMPKDSWRPFWRKPAPRCSSAPARTSGSCAGAPPRSSSKVTSPARWARSTRGWPPASASRGPPSSSTSTSSDSCPPSGARSGTSRCRGSP
jgi:phenylalanyl-tRNA synthetase beta chain